MLTRSGIGWSDFDEMFSTMNQLREYMDRVFDDRAEPRFLSAVSGAWPRANLFDTGGSIVLTAEVPGLAEKDIQITLNQDVLGISGERAADAPEGYSVHRKERPALRFSRSFALPCKVDPERATATVKNGVLTVTLEKARDAMPRHIEVKAN